MTQEHGDPAPSGQPPHPSYPIPDAPFPDRLLASSACTGVLTQRRSPLFPSLPESLRRAVHAAPVNTPGPVPEPGGPSARSDQTARETAIFLPGLIRPPRQGSVVVPQTVLALEANR